MDRSLISKDRRSKEYEDEVECFVAFVVQNFTNKTSIKCPCLQCGNMILHTPQTIRKHLFFYGIDQSYHTRYWHGESAPSGPPTIRAEHYDRLQFNDQHSMIEMAQAAHDDCQNDPELFARLLKDAEKPLYPGCRKFTKLFALIKLYNLKARFGWSDKSFSELLQMLGDMLPLNNELPLSMYESKKTLNALGMEFQKIHACPNDCVLYRNELKDASLCPTCGTSRWKTDKIGTKKRK